jgi:hypothetical protein
MIKKTSILALLVILIPVLVRAQLRSDLSSSIFKPSALLQKPGGIFGKLLDPSKFHMSQSYSISFLTYGKQAINQGLYLNTMSYRFSDPLLAQVQIGYLHQPLGKWGNSGSSNGTLFLSGASLQYQPSERFKMQFDYQSIPSSMVDPYYYRYWPR